MHVWLTILWPMIVLGPAHPSEEACLRAVGDLQPLYEQPLRCVPGPHPELGSILD